MPNNAPANLAAAAAWFGCLVAILSAIAIVFVLTHVGPIWQDLSRWVGS
jgi:hypothetical protein